MSSWQAMLYVCVLVLADLVDATIFDNFTPLKWGQELVIIAVVIIALIFVYTYWSQVVYMLTGDEKIHGGIIDCFYCTFCRCCNFCNGEWTRCLTRCPCCPETVYGRNLVKEFAKCLGLWQTTIEVKNVVVGDLPYDYQLGDFYLAIDVGNNPSMVTALQESQPPKVVHFPEIFQLKVRHNLLEPRVRIAVRELNTFGHDELCELELSVDAIIDWMKDAERPMKRFQMRSMVGGVERETPAWICLEFSEPTENRELGTLAAMDMWGMPGGMGRLQVRTYEYDAAEARSVEMDPVKRKFKTADGSIMGTRKKVDRSIEQMKGQYLLLDETGNPKSEPKESDLDSMECCRKCLVCLWHLYNCLVFLAVLAYCIFRAYVWSCYRQFRWMTMAILNHQALPISNAHLHDIKEKCAEKVRGTGIVPGADACRPNATQTLYVCENIPETNRPEAFVGIVYETFGWNIKGLNCKHGICAFRDKLVNYDHLLIAAMIFLVISSFAFKWAISCCIKCKRQSMQQRAKDEMEARKGAAPVATSSII